MPTSVGLGVHYYDASVPPGGFLLTGPFGTQLPGYASGFLLTAVPEPATLALTAGGLLALAGLARRRRA